MSDPEAVEFNDNDWEWRFSERSVVSVWLSLLDLIGLGILIVLLIVALVVLFGECC